MKSKNRDPERMLLITEKALLSLVSSKLKGRLLFPEMVEDAKKFFNKIKFSDLK
jgi:hypothetical protein